MALIPVVFQQTDYGNVLVTLLYGDWEKSYWFEEELWSDWFLAESMAIEKWLSGIVTKHEVLGWIEEEDFHLEKLQELFPELWL